ncbi:PAS domain S-box protein (plasmid) [Deinococcus sp. KNUC1210]|uniref:HD domain-containing phosphohydrolase n=1 Tax=Deinococcus sp. KNUC1210 TaxID=2917691 RepID=UPI001EF06E7F|nr:HD domain-containing phosphohydrolase [Deinococcus sp. KNUC1210]ULH18350.1 PAS domain S-box protein [Deinococcus sp. KNUC1210]
MSLPPDVSGQEETRRLAALERYAILDTDPEVNFDRLTRLTARIFQMPIVLVSLIDQRRQWFKSCYGLDLRETSRSLSFCAHALESDEVLIIPNATLDERFAENPLVRSEPHIRFYAGAPLITPDGLRLGTLCVIDTVPHSGFHADQQETLKDLASSVMSELELRTALADRRHTEAVNAAILAASPDAIVTLDAQGVITEWNAAAEQLFGSPRAEVLKQSGQWLLSEINDAAVGQGFLTYLQSQTLHQTNRLVMPLRRRDGTTFPGELNLLTLEVNQQRFYTLLVRDLTAQEAARAELNLQQVMLQAVLDSTPAALYVKDVERRYLMINRAGREAVGQPVEAILGKTDEQLFPKSTSAASRIRDEQVIQSQEQARYEVTDSMPDGSVRTFQSTKTVYQNHQGETVGLLGVSLDITERRANEATIRQHNDLLVQRVEHAQLEILKRLARAAEYRDDDTGEHMTRVGMTAAGLARELGLSEAEVDLIQRTAPLHDVGKIGISDSILLKPGRLTAEEFEVVKTHSQIGAEILQGGQSPLVKMAESIALTHHERWDGTGYPAGLAGEAIPLAGRIVAVADVLDALTNERPYKQAWSFRAALAEIQGEAGQQFDPQVVLALLRLHSGGSEQETYNVAHHEESRD